MTTLMLNGRARPEVRTSTQFVALIPRLTRVCQIHGYALGVHGSMVRDLDVIAVPWEEGAVSAIQLRDAIIGEVHGYLLSHEREPKVRPHGRLCWPIYISPEYYIDLSVMPL